MHGDFRSAEAVQVRPTVFPYGAGRLQEDARNQSKGFALVRARAAPGWRSFASPLDARP
jgi:hypothetical protein